MIAIYMVGNNLSLSFNNRRVSSDKNIIDDIYKEYDSINIFSCSKDLFINRKYNIVDSISDGVYFLESNYDILPSKLIIYKFNRDYPSGNNLNINLSYYKIIDSYDFIGNSHGKITKEVYEYEKD